MTSNLRGAPRTNQMNNDQQTERGAEDKSNEQQPATREGRRGQIKWNKLNGKPPTLMCQQPVKDAGNTNIIHGKNKFNSASEIYDSFVKNHDSNIEVKDIINTVGDGRGSGSVNVLAGRQPSLTPAYSTYRLS